LGKRASKLEGGEAPKFVVNTLYMGTMGHIGLTMLIISGGYLMTPYWKMLPTNPLLITKLLLVVLLTLMIIVSGLAARKAKKGDLSGLKMVRKLGPIALITGITIVILAVLVFH
ncbi:MAG: hypothetical protein QNK35_01790, partial [Bacteroides sp.]|nr:hypothetical protein [Bacteroides sp.]